MPSLLAINRANPYLLFKSPFKSYLFIMQTVGECHKAIPEMHIFNLYSGVFKRQIVMAEVPKALYTKTDQLIRHHHSRIFRYTEYRRVGKIFFAELVYGIGASYRQIFNNLTHKGLLTVKKPY